MDSQNENNFTISSQETLLLHQNHEQPKQTKNKNPKSFLFITSFILIITLTVTSTILISMSKPPKPKSIDRYISRSSRYYCHLAYYPDLCYHSMTPIINTTNLQTNPTPIFSTAIQVAIDQLNNITFPKTRDPSLSKCRTWVHDSLSRLNESLCIIDSDIESLTYQEMDNMKVGILNAVRNASECLLGVEEVKMGVEKAMNHMVNSVGLLGGRETILNDFYNRFIEYDDDYYNYYYYYHHQFDFGFLIFLYGGLYLFLWLLYLLFWWSD